MSDEVDLEKRALRAELRERRRIATTTGRAEADAAITQNLIALATRLGTRSLSAYLSRPDEPGTREFLAWACSRGIRVLLPISRADGLLDWAEYDGGDELEDELGIPAPTTEPLSPNALDEVDLILVPAASVDRTGMRMGWGRGYFDKTLGSMQQCPPVYAVIFDDELVDAVPCDRHDQRVNGVVTPSGIVAL